MIWTTGSDGRCTCILPARCRRSQALKPWIKAEHEQKKMRLDDLDDLDAWF